MEQIIDALMSGIEQEKNSLFFYEFFSSIQIFLFQQVKKY